MSTRKENYKCGACGARFQLGSGKEERVACRECGYRLLYKLRTTQGVRYEARAQIPPAYIDYIINTKATI